MYLSTYCYILHLMLVGSKGTQGDSIEFVLCPSSKVAEKEPRAQDVWTKTNNAKKAMSLRLVGMSRSRFDCNGCSWR